MITCNDSLFMNKLFLNISRVFFGSVLMVLFLVFSYVGVLYLAKSEARTGEIFTFNALGNSNLLAVKEAFVDDETKDKAILVDEIVGGGDARPLIIKRYLEKYKSPLLPYSDLIFELSEIYNFEYYWIVAIAQQESNLCKKIPEDSHNCWGYGIHARGTLKFENYETALNSFASYLKREYFDKGLDTPELIMQKYCPHSNGSWAFGVNQFIREMENGQI
jgi:hypothetical protein